MSNARLERLTREALGPERKHGYTKLDDDVLRAVAIAILVLTVIAIASWPRDDAGSQPRHSAAQTQHSAASEPSLA